MKNKLIACWKNWCDHHFWLVCQTPDARSNKTLIFYWGRILEGKSWKIFRYKGMKYDSFFRKYFGLYPEY